MKPRVFIGSSVQKLPIARAIHAYLERDAEVTVWEHGVFGMSQYNLDSLLHVLDATDFGIFVFSADDRITINEAETQFTVRDNVLFESGLFAGRLGRERTFIVVPRTDKNVRFATDLSGLTFGYYDCKQAADGDIRPSLGPVCDVIRSSMRQLSRKSRLLPTAVVAAAADVLKRLARVMESKNLASDIPTVCLQIHQFAQTTFTQLWPEHRVTASLQLIDLESLDNKGNPTHLCCHYAAGITQEPEVFGFGKRNRPVLPIKGSISGEAFQSGQAIFVPNVEREKKRFAPELYARIVPHIGCIVAWPVYMNDQVAAVLEVHARTPSLLAVNNEVFIVIMELVVANLEIALQALSIIHPESLRSESKKPAKKRSAKSTQKTVAKTRRR